jgi:Spy/CpxP family protein refolding chaperone
MKFEMRCGVLPTRRKLLVAGLLIASCWALGTQAGAQTGGHRGGAHGGNGVEREMRELTQALTLTDAQQQQVKPLLVSQRQQMQALRRESAVSDATSEAPRPGREQMEAIRKDTDARISALLDEGQKAKFAAWQQQRKERMEQRRGQEGQDAGPPQP